MLEGFLKGMEGLCKCLLFNVRGWGVSDYLAALFLENYAFSSSNYRFLSGWSFGFWSFNWYGRLCMMLVVVLGLWPVSLFLFTFLIIFLFLINWVHLAPVFRNILIFTRFFIKLILHDSCQLGVFPFVVYHLNVILGGFLGFTELHSRFWDWKLYFLSGLLLALFKSLFAFGRRFTLRSELLCAEVCHEWWVLWRWRFLDGLLPEDKWILYWFGQSLF